MNRKCKCSREVQGIRIDLPQYSYRDFFDNPMEFLESLEMIPRVAKWSGEDNATNCQQFILSVAYNQLCGAIVSCQSSATASQFQQWSLAMPDWLRCERRTGPSSNFRLERCRIASKLAEPAWSAGCALLLNNNAHTGNSSCYHWMHSMLA
jgi:hypothetical protein